MRTSCHSLFSARSITIAMLAVGLTFAPRLFQSSGDVAQASTKKSCIDKHAACIGRCNDKAGLNPKTGGTKQQLDAAQRCAARTCDHQASKCYANETKGSKSAVGISSPVRPGLLDTRPGLSSSGPAATGAPSGGAAPGGAAAPAGGPALR